MSLCSVMFVNVARMCENAVYCFFTLGCACATCKQCAVLIQPVSQEAQLNTVHSFCGSSLTYFRASHPSDPSGFHGKREKRRDTSLLALLFLRATSSSMRSEGFRSARFLCTMRLVRLLKLQRESLGHAKAMASAPQCKECSADGGCAPRPPIYRWRQCVSRSLFRGRGGALINF